MASAQRQPADKDRRRDRSDRSKRSNRRGLARLGERAAWLLSTWFGSGLSPRAPGTVGTLAGLPLVWLVCSRPLDEQLIFISLFTLLSCAAAHVTGRQYGEADAQQIVVDEVCGLLVTLAGLPLRAPVVLAGVLLFRFCDIVKPWPASYFDRKVKNGVGVVLDDVMAGLYARLLLALLALAWPGTFGA